MSTSKIIFYPVNNGAMALLKLNDDKETTIMVDMNIREAADDDDEDEYDVANHLRSQLKEDDYGRPYLDAFVLSHNDDDHIKGIQNHFHLGSLDGYKEPEEGEKPKIIINEIWATSRFWKRASDSNKLCDDAKAFNREMKRRVKIFENTKKIPNASDRALIIGEDPDGKTDDLDDIVMEVGSSFSEVNRQNLSKKIQIKILGPLSQQKNEADEDFNKKNRGSVILLIKIKESGYENKLLLPGDAEVLVWECLWGKYKNNISNLEYDILLAPHHCSWHSLSYDSQSQCDNPEVSEDAESALSQAKEGAYIISSSKPIKNNDDDPPSFAAKKEYLVIVKKKHFLCTEEYPKEGDVEPIVLKLTSFGPQLKGQKSKSRISQASSGPVGQAFGHG
ncbi:MAG: hypothetical protein KAW12_24110 [Candidatus Aminicenantes bacterium]|nr:hypothetical protein [Candidatus Aminicenantes bacterium]